jgi:hypothetical protein
LNSYRRLSTEFYDIDKPHPPKESYDFYRDYVANAVPPVLEPMSGSGRFLVPMLFEGFVVEGTDASPQMLQACRNLATRRALFPVLYEQYLHELKVPKQYGLIFIPDGSISLIIDPAQVHECLTRMFAALLPRGKLVMEVEHLVQNRSFDWPWGGRWVTRPDGAKILNSWLGRYDHAEQVSYSIGRYELIQDGQLLETEFEDFNLRYYTTGQFAALLEGVGFAEIRTGKLLTWDPVSATDTSFVVECRKPGP